MAGASVGCVWGDRGRPPARNRGSETRPCRDDRSEARDYRIVVTRKSEPITLSGLRSDSSINYHRERALVRRLFSTFAYGWPGVGLLFMRLAAGIALMARKRIDAPDPRDLS